MRISELVQVTTAGILAAVVGFASSFAVVLEGLTAVGASRAEAASGLTVLMIAMGVCGIVLSLRTRMPVSIAWSTPGAALLVTAGMPEGGFSEAVGAFLLSGLLVVAAALWKPLGRWVSAIPTALANAMLAGILFGLCLAPVRAVAEAPWQALAVIGTWALVARANRLMAVPAALVLTAVLMATTIPPTGEAAGSPWPHPVLVAPSFSLPAAIGLALPLFIVTMASQNIPGFAVLHANGYRPPPAALLGGTGIASILAAPFGSIPVTLAAITAAMCAGVDAHPDPRKRYWAAVVAGVAYILIGVSVAAIVAFVAASPSVLITAVAGLALLGPFASAITAATARPTDREAAIVTFVVTASGIGFLGISGAFWGLVAGGCILALTRWRRPTPIEPERPDRDDDRI